MDSQTTVGGAVCPDTNTIITAVGDWQTRIVAITRNANATNPTWDLISGTERNYTYHFFAFHPGNSNIAYAGYYKFTNIQSSNTYSTLSKEVIAMYPGDGDIVYTAEAAGSNTRIFKSTDKGVTWIAPFPDLPTLRSNVGQITIDPNNQDKIYIAATTKGIYIINGSSYSLKNEANGLDKSWFNSLDTYSITVDPIDTNVLYAGCRKGWMGQSNGVFRSTDGGDTWISITGSLDPEFNVYTLSVNPSNRYIYLGSHHGTWKLQPPGTTISPDTTPPTVSITSPTTSSAYSTTQSTIALSGTASDNVGVTSVTWTNSANSTSGTASGTTSWSIASVF